MPVQFRFLRDRNDLVLVAAIALLPADGTVLGVYAPFWTPISPWLFLLYAALNWRLVPAAYHRFRMFFWLPAALLTLSIGGWVAFGFHWLAAAESLFGLLGALACLVSLDIAITQKRLDWRRLIHIGIAAYWIAFGVGVMQWLAIQLDVQCVIGYFKQLMARQYIGLDSPWGGGRPQFLFAEPSYIGMHLYGVLLPLMWMMRGRDTVYARRLSQLIVVFAAGSLIMGAGTRIVLDSLVALVVVIVERTQWHHTTMRKRGVLALLGTLALGAASLLLNDRLFSIAQNGMTGDGSFFARIYQSLGPLMGLLQHPWTLLTGYGAGNIADATHAGAADAEQLLERFAGSATSAHGWYAKVNHTNMFTMSGWTSYLVEFGLIGVALLTVMVIRYITRHCGWHKTVVCWLALVVYLYIQFEGYAFYALPLLVWACGMLSDKQLMPAETPHAKPSYAVINSVTSKPVSTSSE